MTTAITLHPWAGHSLPALADLLAEAGLPHGDLAAHLEQFVVAEQDGRLVGAGGFESCGDGVGLLRSFVVRPDHRCRGLGHRLLQAVLNRADEAGIADLYLLTTTAADWFAAQGFAPAARADAPAAIRATRQFGELCPASAAFMHRRLDAGDAARRRFDAGLYCAESVLAAVARQRGIESPLIPAIATGLCSGLARTGGPCGALTGGILALNIVHGRADAAEPVEQNYRQVQRLIQEFEAAHGATCCDALLGCHLGTPEGQTTFREQRLHERCREYVANAARLAVALLDEAKR